jgi:hypothetical protein
LQNALNEYGHPQNFNHLSAFRIKLGPLMPTNRLHIWKRKPITSLMLALQLVAAICFFVPAEAVDLSGTTYKVVLVWQYSAMVVAALHLLMLLALAYSELRWQRWMRGLALAQGIILLSFSATRLAGLLQGAAIVRPLPAFWLLLVCGIALLVLNLRPVRKQPTQP